MATSRYLQPRQPGGRRTISSNPADQQENDPNGVYIPGRAGRMDARPRNALYLPGTGPGTGRTGIRTGIVNRDGSTSPLSSMGYRTGLLSETRPSSLPDPNNPEASRASNSSASYTRTPHSDTQESDAPDTGTETQDTGTQNTRDPNSGGQGDRQLNPNAPLVYNPISLDNPGGNFVMQGATIADSSYMPDGSNNDASQNNDDNEPPRKRIDARPRNNIYMPGTGPGTGRTAIRTDTINGDGTTSPVSSMGYATGPLSLTRPSSLPDKKPVITQEAAAAPAAATPGLPETLKTSTRQFGSNGEQKIQPLAPLTPAVIPSTIDLPSSSKPAIAPNAITSGVSGSIKASTQQFGSPLGAPKPAAAPPSNRTTASLDTLKTSTPPLGTTPPLNTKAPALSLTPSLGGIPTPKPSTSLDTIGLSNKPYGSTTMSGPLDLLGVKKRAMGGPVRAGRPYLVGEKGPEVIVPQQSGTVVPNHALFYQPLNKAPAQPPSPAGGYTAEPASDDNGDAPADRPPRYDSSFDEPHELPSPASDGEEPGARTPAYDASFDEPNDAADHATEPSTDTTPTSAERPTTGLLMRPRPMPPEYAQQKASGNIANSSPGKEPTDTSIHDEADDPSETPGENRPPETAAQAPAYTDSRWLHPRPAPASSAPQQAGTLPNAPSQQRPQESQRVINTPQQQVRQSNPPAKGSKPAAHSQAVSPYRGPVPDKMDEGRVAPPENLLALVPPPVRWPTRRTGWTPVPPSKLSEIEQRMAEALLARRKDHDKQGKYNMPLSTDELTVLMEEDYKRGLEAMSDGNGMTPEELIKDADNAYFYHIEPDKELHPGHEGHRGSGFSLKRPKNSKFKNPYLDPMARGDSEPYFGWEINYNVVGQWLRIAGYSRIAAAHILSAWLLKSPSKWKTLNLDRQTWFWVGYNYADARQNGWNPMKPAPAAKPGNK
ncbi:MAG: hypothetical protein JWR15_1396 [Prosthecobacter sp.]|nr:hypothetical protein [Prosthecobacter sp.]